MATFAPSAIASLAEEMSAAAGTSEDVQQLPAETVLRSFSSVAVRLKRRELPAHVSAAVSLRPDLAARIAAAALRSQLHNSPAGRGTAVALTGRIIKAAVEANPAEAVAIVVAALEVAPSFAECIVAAAIAAAPDQKIAILHAAKRNRILFAFLRFSRLEHGGASFDRAGALNPGSLSVRNNVLKVVSPEQPFQE